MIEWLHIHLLSCMTESCVNNNFNAKQMEITELFTLSIIGNYYVIDYKQSM